MQLVYVDFETYFDKVYSLKKMTIVEYVRDARYKTLGVSVAIDDEPIRFLDADEFAAWVTTIDWGNSTLVAHNARFDGSCLWEQYGIKPAKYHCTMAMAKALLPIDSASLASVSRALGLGAKGNALVEGSDEVTDALKDYANNDAHLCREIYKTLRPIFRESEMDLISLTTRWGVEAKLELDAPLLDQALQDAVEERSAAIAASGYTEEQLTSNPKFAAILRSLGIDPPEKISATTGEATDAFAKGDPEFQELIADYPEHRPLFEGRLAAKSNINIRRAEKFLAIAKTGRLPVPLQYWGAITGRWSGTDGINLQNLPRKSALRKSIRAPKGKVLVVVDSAQIELRLNLWFAGQTDRLGILRNGGDIYRQEASTQFNKPIEQVTPDERQFGKIVQLACGYGLGHKKFQQQCAAGPMGMKPIQLTDSEAFRTIHTYRQAHAKVKGMWDTLQQVIPEMMLKNCCIDLGPIRLLHETVELPNGLFIQYPHLRYNEQGGFEYGMGKKVSYLYGGKMDENVIQALARIVVADQMLEIDKCFETVSMTHDEAIYLADEAEAEAAFQYGVKVFSTPPAWAPDLPLSADGGYAENYSK